MVNRLFSLKARSASKTGAERMRACRERKKEAAQASMIQATSEGQDESVTCNNTRVISVTSSVVWPTENCEAYNGLSDREKVSCDKTNVTLASKMAENCDFPDGGNVTSSEIRPIDIKYVYIKQTNNKQLSWSSRSNVIDCVTQKLDLFAANTPNLPSLEPPPTSRKRAPQLSDSALNAEFSFWWQHALSGRKVAKDKAAQAYGVVRRNGATAEELLAGIKRDVAVWETWPKTDLQFTPHPATWLRSGRWKGDPPEARTHSNKVPHADLMEIRARQREQLPTPLEGHPEGNIAAEKLLALAKEKKWGICEKLDIDKLVRPLTVKIFSTHLVGRMRQNHTGISNQAERSKTASLLDQAAQLLDLQQSFLVGPDDPEPVPLTTEEQEARRQKTQQLLHTYLNREEIADLKHPVGNSAVRRERGQTPRSFKQLTAASSFRQRRTAE